jgi:hypothetical protein
MADRLPSVESAAAGASGLPPQTDVQLYRVVDAMRVLSMSRQGTHDDTGRVRAVRSR